MILYTCAWRIGQKGCGGLSLRFYSGPFMSLSYSEEGECKLNKTDGQAEEKTICRKAPPTP